MLFDFPDFDNHELVLFGRDEASGLAAIIAVHSTALGPACGGCRMWPYANDTEAMRDALRLSRGMSYKNAMAGLPLGGGKSVIIGDSRKDKTDELFRAFGRVIDSLGGKYIAAEDVGITVADVMTMGQTTRHVAGLSKGHDASGDPSPFTAYGVYMGIKAAVKHKLATDSLRGVRVAVQGLGNVGSHLCQRLADDGAILTVTDIHADAVQRAVDKFGAMAVAPDRIHAADADVYAPCALGAVINPRSLPELKAKIVAGGANNQLETDPMGEALRAAGILYAPDYVINGGGIINVSAEVTQDYDRDSVLRQVERIPVTLTEIFRRADWENRPTSAVADEMAREILAAGKGGQKQAA
ncbi:Leu/Phe/Val dehydrogenase [Niveispirillum cyanobacteriorum]|uniref:Amino acid dehydrogenase n=1 Tax=Niveispirillum cyanobacteriorum TaxID=1612173 RepID=A0A2K9NEV0_9PROT|nr:Glu/Leu/Phe/Val dehydrogenase [Niveispirillum cyanobacteriorum]AUN31532.1 amino acid dehydrogenase [Niveispirillum cyanobacteriorum]GGE70386.1 leucine dehydrogenase [Niveispirillum cyanobacteriorum]